MPMYNLLEYNNNYSKTFGILWQYCRGETAVNNNGAIVNFVENNTTSLFKIEEKISCYTGDDRTKSVEIMVPSKHLSNFRGTLEMLLINCEINRILNWSANCVYRTTENSAFCITAQDPYLDFQIDSHFQGVNKFFALLFENNAHRTS